MADKLTIRTNNVPRDTIDWNQLTKEEQKEFDYLDTDERRCETQFVRYKGWVYDVHEFMAIDQRVAPHPQRPGWEQWDGYQSDSFFSGVLIRYHKEGCCWTEQVVMATYYA